MAQRALPDPELLAEIVESLPDAVVIADRTGTIVLANRQLELLFGHPRAFMIGKPIESLLPEPLHERHRAHFAGFVKEPRVRPMGVGLTLTAINRSGEEFPVEINLAPLVVTDGIYFCAVIRKKS